MNEWLVKNERERRALAALSHARLNFDPSRRREFTSANGWHLDQHRELLPAEPPGPPVSGGSWETACRLMRGYEFADPAIVRAFYNPEEPLEGRNMLFAKPQQSSHRGPRPERLRMSLPVESRPVATANDPFARIELGQESRAALQHLVAALPPCS